MSQMVRPRVLTAAHANVALSVPLCTNPWRYKDEYRERTGKELHFHQFPADRKLLLLSLSLLLSFLLVVAVVVVVIVVVTIVVVVVQLQQ